MKKFLLMMLLAIGITTTYAKDKKPEVDMKEDTVLVDGKPEYILERIKSNTPTVSNFYVKELNGKKLAFLQYNSYTDPNLISQYNRTGNVSYYVITFLESKQTAEIRYVIRYKSMAAYLIETKLIQNGTITKEAEDEYVLVNGHTFSANKPTNNGNTIIINNNTTTPKNGVQFNFGN